MSVEHFEEQLRVRLEAVHRYAFVKWTSVPEDPIETFAREGQK